jgi:hypothetical protein
MSLTCGQIQKIRPFSIPLGANIWWLFFCCRAIFPPHLPSLRFALHQVSRIPQPSPQDPTLGATPPCSRLPHQVSRIPQPLQLAASSTIVGDGVIRLLCNLFSPLFGAAVRGDQESGVRWAGYGGVLEPQQEVTQVSCHTLG